MKLRLKSLKEKSAEICERFYKTIQQEFYAVALRTKIYNTLDEIENDLDKCL